MIFNNVNYKLYSWVIIKVIFTTIVLSFSLCAKSFRILSIDGGGVRGIVASEILHEIEKRTGRPISESFDLIVGNSTGGLIALALVTPGKNNKPKYSAQSLLEMYMDRSHEIFPQSMWNKVKSGWGLWSPKYNREPYDKILSEFFGDVKFSETIKPCVVISYSIDNSLPHFWSSRVSKSSRMFDYKLRDLAGATSAAPTYFAPKKITKPNGKVIYEIDGGTYANNPEMIGVIEAFNTKPELRRSDIVLISIGTGKVKTKRSGKELSDAGIVGWFVRGNLMDVMMGASAELGDSTAASLFKHYQRLEVDIPKELSEMDNSDSENLKALRSASKEYIQLHIPEIQKVCDEIASVLK